MRKLLLLAAVSIAAGLVPVASGAARLGRAAGDAASAAAAAGSSSSAVAATTLTATPNPVRLGRVVTVRGRGWPVIEFCVRRVRISLQSAQNASVLGFAPVRASGRFRFRWTPRRAQVGAGAWRVVARMRCESGKDGSTVFVRRAVPLRIR
jgi:hypothetical protein